MASSLFLNNPQSNQGQIQGTQNNPFQVLSQISNMMKGRNPEEVAAVLMQQNPRFAQFMQSVQGKTPEQFSREHGIDFGMIMRFMK